MTKPIPRRLLASLRRGLDARRKGEDGDEAGCETTLDMGYRTSTETVRPGPMKLVPVLKVVSGRDLMAFARLDAGQPVVVGRGPECDLVLEDPSVSRRHVRLSWDGSACAVEDLRSTNGTRVAGEAVERGDLLPETILEAGNVSLRLELLLPREVQHLERVNEAVLRAADRDPLTGLRSRAFLEDELPRVVARCRQQEQPVSAIFLDVDHFKAVNDRFGHPVGDAVLVQLVRLALHNSRSGDTWIRYGGEELVLFLPGADGEAAWRVAERLRLALMHFDWTRTATDLAVTASMGIATLRDGETVDSWLGRADGAMYRAKRRGRNRVERAD